MSSKLFFFHSFILVRTFAVHKSGNIRSFTHMYAPGGFCNWHFFSWYGATQASNNLHLPSNTQTHAHTHIVSYCQYVSCAGKQWKCVMMLPDSPLNQREMRMQLDCHPRWSYCRHNRWKKLKERRFIFGGSRVFSGWVDDFCADIWHDIKWLRDDDYCVWSAVSLCVCSLWVGSAAEFKRRAED